MSETGRETSSKALLEKVLPIPDGTGLPSWASDGPDNQANGCLGVARNRRHHERWKAAREALGRPLYLEEREHRLEEPRCPQESPRNLSADRSGQEAPHR